MGSPTKAITICQPFAELICAGEKRVENRSWPTRYRGELLIHAGKNRSWLDLDESGKRDRACRTPVAELAFGAIVARAMLVDCLDINGIRRGSYGHLYPWLRDHDHANGPWCWILADVERLPRPIPWRGAQGLFTIPAEALPA